jgi:hypothetical protein
MVVPVCEGGSLAGKDSSISSFSFSSSGQLAQQLVEGAPMDLYASANAAFVDRVLDAGVGDPATRATYAYGRIVLWSPAGAWGGWDGLEALAHARRVPLREPGRRRAASEPGTPRGIVRQGTNLVPGGQLDPVTGVVQFSATQILQGTSAGFRTRTII